MRLSVAGAAKDAQVQNDILLSDFTRNLVVVGRQPHPDPNFPSYVLPGRPIALLWRFRELPEDLASYGPLPGLLSAAASLLFSCSVVAFSVLLRSLHCCPFYPLPLLVVLAPFFLFIVLFFFEHNLDKKGIALVVLNNSADSGASAPFALTCAENAQDRVRASQETRPGD